jgi:hypothetical protein
MLYVMKIIRKSILALCLALTALSQTFAQKIEVENTYDISRKAKRGELAKVEQDENNNYILYYLLRSSARKLKVQIYTFDNDFRFISEEEYEDDIEKVKTKYKWVKGEAEGTEKLLLRVESNLGGQIVLKYGKLVQRVNWDTGEAYWDWVTIEKIKPKDAEGRKLSLISYLTDEPNFTVSNSGFSWLGLSTATMQDATGNLTLFCNVVNKVKDMKSGNVAEEPFGMIEYAVSDRSIVDEKYFGKKELSNRFQGVVYQQHLENGNYGMVYAATGGKAFKKYQNLTSLDYQYLEVSFKEKKIVKSIPFKSLDSYWKINAIELVGDDVYIHGVGVDKKNTKFYNELAIADKGKYTNYQIAKLAGNSLAWINKTNLEEFATKLKTPPSQKKTPEFTGQKFLIGEFTVAKSGDIFINGQNIKVTDKGTKYKDVFVFHFGNNGILKAQYGLDIKENNKYSDMMQTTSLFKETQDGKSMSWIILEVADVKATASGGRVLNYARVANIDIAGATVPDFKDLGQEGKEKYYLYNDFPILPSKGGDKMTFFGSDKSGKTIWFSRVIF